MAPFQYEAPVNPYGASIGALLAHANDAAARATEISGNAWGRAAENIGQIPQQIQQQKNEEQLGKLRQSEIDKNNQEIAGQQRAVKGQQLLGQLTQKYTTTDPTTGVRSVDHDAIANDLTTNGFGAEAERFLHGAAVTAEDREKIKALKKQSAAATDVALGNIAIRAKNPADFMNDLDHLTLDDTVTPPQRQALAQELSQLTPDTWEAWKQKTISKADQAAPPKTLKPDEIEVGAVSHTPLATAPASRKTESELAADAANPQSPTHDQSKAALELLQTTKGSPSGELKPGRLGGKMVFAIFDPKTKRATYQGQDVTDQLEPLRDPMEAQAAAIAAQVAQQQRTQTFNEQQAGRKELTDKVEQPFRQAQQSAQEMRDLVAAAKSGNKEAASLQALQATMTTVRANGLNRLNQAEMNLPANAGSLWDRIQSQVGKAVAGQPIDAALQKDMLEYADLIEKGAYNRYKTSHHDVTTRYKLTDERLAAPPGAPSEGTERTVDGVTRVWGYHNGTWGWALK